MNFEEAQADMRRAYYDGATGVLASASAWLAAAIVAWRHTPQAAIFTLLIGGMLIYPASVLLSKALGRSGVHAKTNPLAPLAASGTLWMLLVIPVAYGASLYRLDWFFPAMLLIIGGRYLTFATLYGTALYYALGAALAMAGLLMALAQLPVLPAVIAGSAIEYLFAAILIARAGAHAVQHGIPADVPGPSEYLR
jgi:hypothetical protein